MENKKLDIRNYNELTKAISIAQHTVYKRYLPELKLYPLVQPTPILLDEDTESCCRFIQLEELSYKRGEDILQKLSNVYHASMSLDCNLVVIVDVERIDAPVKIYVGVRNTGESSEAKASLSTSFRTLKNGIKSNFPGTKFKDIPSQNEMPVLLSEIFGNQTKYISSVSCVASIRDKSKTENKSFIQGIERFIDAMQGHTYTALFIADPTTFTEQAAFRSGYEELYSTLSSFQKSVWSYNENESMSVMRSLSNGVSKAITDGTNHTQAHTINIGANIGINSSNFSNETISHSTTDTETNPTAASRIGKALPEAGKVLSGAGKFLKLIGSFVPVFGAVGSVVESIGNAASGPAGKAIGEAMEGSTTAHAVTESIANTIGKSLGLSGGLNAGYARTISDTTSHSATDTTSETKTTGTTNTTGTGKTLQIENVNKPIEEMLKQIEEQLKRTKEGEDYGAYNCGAYFLSGRQESTLLAANTYRALMLGEGSSVESGAINFWNGVDEPEKVAGMKEYLRRFVHPIFAMPITEEVRTADDFIPYTPGTIVSGLELPLHLGLPTRSVYGLPVMEHAEFGRNVTDRSLLDPDDSRKIKIGQIYHMGQVEKKSLVELNAAGLTAHTFVTGSTGSGKSNTIYSMLEKLYENDVNFLVVEPAKGEYKTALRTGERKIAVYGTNPNLKDTHMLHINPFRFPENIHILEHLDRLVEIFNVCWPMYAAMPAILKDSIERAYEAAGWNLNTSQNKYDSRLYPTFGDVLKQIRIVLSESEYSSDNKGDYTGALVTRIRSLTNGINGLIFTSNDIPDEYLFDRNVIVDLSRVGSTETKSLIMGLLVLKLQEHRMQSSQPNEKLRHVTVLEEAHNLLKRTSTEQTTEGANLLGKSVEMLANSIAEMRTYGEGFIIADQSPGLLDMSVIRNTNTKIILRLPDFSDRELVGKAAGLNDNQIIELGKLERGVASITQSDWLEPVLCKIDKYDGKGTSFETGQPDIPTLEETDSAKESLLDCIMNREIYRKGDRVDIQRLKEVVIKSKLDAGVKCDFLDYISVEDPDKAVESLRKLVYDFFSAEQAIKAAEPYDKIEDWERAVMSSLEPSIQGYSQRQIELVLAMIVYEKAERDITYRDVLRSFVELHGLKGSVI